MLWQHRLIDNDIHFITKFLNDFNFICLIVAAVRHVIWFRSLPVFQALSEIKMSFSLRHSSFLKCALLFPDELYKVWF